ncbi:hypothetical protein Gasu2_42640 [Galdieria sulphuraria]|uniref:Uncharacterized protein n=1 Tax=Galdieria sulphuraria TaxID=130081 RepID=M2X8G0_GALSU|nr:uncharacterized protein Gasu_62170 [Galdieria sulphuraria]EME26137.1 hypothetical protein Gasu_62170 [Galdieria sulphuraria]GJD10045.1 hypothetical protein Gasu2_42640 [Galdieria sulphuraria]|eukprot:XP_005702657.1 hypothetical protein Gasu_62170 [Galdieria sulphuraria]
MLIEFQSHNSDDDERDSNTTIFKFILLMAVIGNESTVLPKTAYFQCVRLKIYVKHSQSFPIKQRVEHQCIQLASISLVLLGETLRKTSQ